MIFEKCENCAMYNNDYQKEYCYVCDIETDDHDDFIPKEDVVRQDEKENIIKLLNDDLDKYKKLHKEFNSNIVSDIVNHDIETFAIIRYIETTINRLESEK